MAQAPQQLPQANTDWVHNQRSAPQAPERWGKPTQVFASYMASVDTLLRFLANNQSTPPQVSVFSSGSSGTYTTPIGALYLVVEMGAPGGGSAGSGTGATAGGNAGNTTLGSSFLTCIGGFGGQVIAIGGSGGGATGGDINVTGGQGGGSQNLAAGLGGHGGASFYGGGAGSTATGNVGVAGQALCSGASGAAAASATGWSAAGGGAGGYLRKLIVNPAASYAYSVGAVGTAGAAGTTGFAGATGQTGVLTVTAYFS